MQRERKYFVPLGLLNEKTFDMIMKYRVSLPGIKGFARVYELKSNSSLYTFAKRMRTDMSFPQDQMVLFKAFDAAGNVSARYGVFDLGAGTIDAVTLEQTVKKGELSFVFFYDTTNAKSVIVTYEGNVNEEKGMIYPRLVETKGPDPIEFENGYVAYEDLPDDKKKKFLDGELDDDSDSEEDEDDDVEDDEMDDDSYDEDE